MTDMSVSPFVKDLNPLSHRQGRFEPLQLVVLDAPLASFGIKFIYGLGHRKISLLLNLKEGVSYLSTKLLFRIESNLSTFSLNLVRLSVIQKYGGDNNVNHVFESGQLN